MHDMMSMPADALSTFNLIKFMGFFLISLMALFVFFMPSDHDARNLYFKLQKVEENDDVAEDELLPRGLFDEKSCLSRYEYVSYRRRGLKRRTPSPELISKLRSYEGRHKRCAPYTDSYNRTVKYLVQNSSTSMSCKYIVWISMNGLGNQMLSMASAFLYALLTDRVLLVDRGVDIPDLFCDPFPEASWFLPSDFPLTSHHFNTRSPQTYGNLLRNTNTTTNNESYAYIYLNLAHGYDKYDKRVFCDGDQTYLHTIPWLLIKSDFYFVPALFMMPSFQQQLHHLFPEKDTVFHFLSRYLFHPTNSVWGLVTRYYQAYLSTAHLITGIQLRIFRIKPLLEQILSCTMRENHILPQINDNTNLKQKNNTTVAVLITSLSSGYYEKIREMYLENPTAAGEVVGVFQPSHEEFQQTGKHSHNRKALAEIYLLSLTDRLVTSGWSTFGYVAQGIGGLKPWILYRPENPTAPEPPCVRAMSMEPCFQGPRSYDCNSRRGGMDKDVRHCEDMSRGLKLINSELI